MKWFLNLFQATVHKEPAPGGAPQQQPAHSQPQPQQYNNRPNRPSQHYSESDY